MPPPDSPTSRLRPKVTVDSELPTSSSVPISRWISPTSSIRSRKFSPQDDSSMRTRISIGTSGPRCFSSHL